LESVAQGPDVETEEAARTGVQDTMKLVAALLGVSGPGP
jgi:hypothetical protein